MYPCISTQYYWVGHKICSGFSIRHKKTKRTFWPTQYLQSGDYLCLQDAQGIVQLWWFITHIYPFQIHNSVVFSRFQSCTSIITILEHFQYLKKKPLAQQQSLPPTPHNHWSTFFLYGCGGFFWTFHTNGIMQPVVLCDWLLSTSIMFQGPSTLEYVSALHPFLWPNNICIDR